MKKPLLACLLLLGLSIIFISCEKDDPSKYSELIIGEWVLDKAEMNGKVESTPVKSLAFTYSTMIIYYDTGDESGSYPQPYYIDGHDNTIRKQDGDIVFTILRLTSSKLNLEEVSKDGIIKAYFKRK